MSLEGSHLIRGYMYDVNGSAVAGATITVSNVTGSETTTETETTKASGYYQINVQDICDEGDLINIRFVSGGTTIDEFIIVNLDDLTQTVNATTQNRFLFQTDSYYMWFIIPDYQDSSKELGKYIRLFNFWDNSLDINDLGIDDEPLVLNIAMLVGIPTRDTISGKADALYLVMNDGESVTITGIHGCINAVYIIKHTSFSPIKNTDKAFTLQITLEFKEES